MTEERKMTDPGAADDSRVSEIYRDIARERTPEHLDKAVLREAARAAQPRYSRLRLWTRPAAWAAVVLISATLLLQVSQLQPPQEAMMPKVPDFDDGPATAAGTNDLRQAEEAVIESLESAGRDADMFRQAEDMARIQQGPNEALAAPQPTSLRAVSAKASRPAAAACDEEARAAPESWLVCIVALEEAGMNEAARRERSLLKESFPDFDTP
jgi:hypothetical protein